MPNYTKITLNDLVSKNNKKITEFEFLLEHLPKLNKDGPWIAGGSLVRTYMGITVLNDIDVFFSSTDQCKEYHKELKEQRHFSITSDTHSRDVNDIVINFRGKTFKIQLITIELFDRATSLLDKFDLNICQLAYDGTYVYVAESTLQSIDNRQIMINTITFPEKMISRCMKYAKLGFSLPNSEITKFFDTIKKDKTILDNKNQEKYVGL